LAFDLIFGWDVCVEVGVGVKARERSREGWCFDFLDMCIISSVTSFSSDVFRFGLVCTFELDEVLVVGFWVDVDKVFGCFL